MIYRFRDYAPAEILRGHLNLGGKSPAGEEIAVNSLYFERGGKPWLPVMGEYHFSRDSREHWPAELAKMRAGGVNIISTYLIWLYHEEIEGEMDFSGDLDVRAFVEECSRQGLDVVLRIGPWAHGEARNGGFPDWLLEKPFPLRDNNPGYMALARRWYRRIYDEVKGLLYKDGGNIIGVQIENELVDRGEHIGALKELAVEVGFDVPLYTVTGWNSMYGARFPEREFVPLFAAYCHEPWLQHTGPMPPSPQYVFDPMRNNTAMGLDVEGKMDNTGWQLPYHKYPYAMCEMGPGLQSTHHRRVVVSGMDAYAMSLTKLGCGCNLAGYYMYHGGTNRLGKLSTLQETRSTGGYNDYTAINYDFGTCLSQYGQTREQYGMLNILHLFINDFGVLLAPMELTQAEKWVEPGDFDSLRYAMRRDRDGGFVFVNHYQRLASLRDHTDVEFDTGDVRFPPIDVRGDVAFILPFNLKMGDVVLRYATAQPVCEVEGAWFFAAIPGVEPEYKFASGEGITAPGDRLTAEDICGVKIVTLPFDSAKYLRKLSGGLCLGEGCDLYELDGRLEAVGFGDYSYGVWNGEKFEYTNVRRPFTHAKITFEDVSEPFEPPYIEELNFGGERARTWKQITVTGDEGMVEIPFEYDTAQIYADGNLVADNFYAGQPWPVPASLLAGRECYLVMSELRDDIYREFYYSGD